MLPKALMHLIMGPEVALVCRSTRIALHTDYSSSLGALHILTRPLAAKESGHRTLSLRRPDVATAPFLIIILLSTMPVTIDHNFFPHIVEEILFYADRKTLLASRFLSSSIRHVADDLLTGEGLSIVYSKSDAGPNSYSRSVSAVGSSLEAITNGPPRLRVPYFHPDGDLEAQYRAVGRASQLSLVCPVVTPEINNLLQCIQPTCHVHLDHADGFATSSQALCIPPTASLGLEVISFCCSPSNVETFGGDGPTTGILKHHSSFVTLHLFDECQEPLASFLPPCCLVRQIVTPTVERLEVSGNVCVLPFAFRLVNVKSNPNLQITLVHVEEDCRKLGRADVENLRHDTAVIFKIPVHQVHYVEKP